MNISIHRGSIAATIATVVVLSAAAFTQSIRAAPPPETPKDSSTDTHPTAEHDTSGSVSHQMPGMMQHDGHAMMMMDMPGKHMGGATPALPGQDAFGAIQEIVAKLDADPNTDWSKVDLEALRQHLIDMNEVTLMADAATRLIDGGIEITATGSGRTQSAIQRMLPAHALEINGINGWSARTEPLPNGVLMIVTAKDSKEVQRIRGLGFIGILVSGAHHQAHHLAMAKGAFPHQH